MRATYPARMKDSHDLAMRRVRTAQDWRAVRALRCEVLAGHGEIAPGAREYADAFDACANTQTYLLEARGRAVGTTRSSIATPFTDEALPSQRLFARELEAAFGARAAIVEASLTVVDPHGVQDAQDALMRLFRPHIWRCAAEGADALVVAVRESRIGFYRRRFDMEILSGAERYPGMATPRVLMGLAWREHAQRLLRRLPVLAATAEDEAAFAAP